MMLTLTIFPDGHVILSSDHPISHDAADRIRELFETWRNTPYGVAILEAKVEHAESIELDLEAVAA